MSQSQLVRSMGAKERERELSTLCIALCTVQDTHTHTCEAMLSTLTTTGFTRRLPCVVYMLIYLWFSHTPTAPISHCVFNVCSVLSH